MLCIARMRAHILILHNLISNMHHSPYMYASLAANAGRSDIFLTFNIITRSVNMFLNKKHNSQ